MFSDRLSKDEGIGCFREQNNAFAVLVLEGRAHS